MKVVSEWASHARAHKSWNAELVGLVDRVIRERRINHPFNIDQIFSSRREVASATMGTVIEELEKNSSTKGWAPELQIVRSAFTQIDPQLFYPYADRIKALASRPGAAGELLLPVIGRVGIDPTPFLLPFDPPNADEQLFIRLRGACYAESKWASVLVPHVQEALARIAAEGKLQSNYAKALRRTLSRHNALELALTFVEPGDEHEARYLKARAQDLKKHGYLDCGFWF
jgi:hypothetical protein